MNHLIEINEKQADLFKALGHPTRLILLKALTDSEKCVCELQPLIGDKLPTISRHLAVLKENGIVSCRKQGLQVFYRLEMQCLKSLLNCSESFLLNRLTGMAVHSTCNDCKKE